MNRSVKSWLMVSPLAGVMLVFLVLPIAMIVVLSFWRATESSVVPDFVFEESEFLFGSPLTCKVFLNTFECALVIWVRTPLIGFSGACVLALRVRSLTWQIVLFLLWTIPFRTSNTVGMISRIPFLGRNGIANSSLISMAVIDAPLVWLLFSDFAVIPAFVHLYTLFVVVQIFDTMMRIDRSLIEAAQILWNVIVPLTKPGIMIGTFFVMTLVMGDFITVRCMSGSQSANAGRLISNDIALLQYPSAAATAVILLVSVLLVIGVLLRFVGIRKVL
ncbi:ABC transporter permease [Maliponia aquimaris]|uniref:Spermidine/putrescine transport system permease protein PotB n=1 Tax=Maliponia aquimaris TaxID=1673631 RepID=A0A238L2G1_9RHOB|nr:ABC transporter permease [Maliponia aquimaris]SMX48526.1 Spermidine/putrescine transport system permease protein PotB [Maliponia aquimaris]